MATNEVFADYSRNRSLPVAADTASGAPVKVGSLVGVALTKEGQGGNADGYATVAMAGVYTLPCSDAVASIGLPLYITSGGAITTTATSNTLFGYSMSTKSSGAGSVDVEISQV